MDLLPRFPGGAGGKTGSIKLFDAFEPKTIEWGIHLNYKVRPFIVAKATKSAVLWPPLSPYAARSLRSLRRVPRRAFGLKIALKVS